MTSTQSLKRSLGQVAVVLAFSVPATASALPVFPKYSQASFPRQARATSHGTNFEPNALPDLTISLLDEASREVDRARDLLECTDLRGERAFDDYLAELGRALAAWRSLTPRARDESERVQQVVGHSNTALALTSLTTSLALARGRLADAVEKPASWIAVRRALGDGAKYADLPARFVVDTPVRISHDSPLDVARIATWLDLNES